MDDLLDYMNDNNSIANKKQNLFNKKCNIVKTMLFNHFDVPISWKKKKDYKVILKQLVCTDQNFNKYIARENPVDKDNTKQDQEVQKKEQMKEKLRKMKEKKSKAIEDKQNGKFLI